MPFHFIRLHLPQETLTEHRIENIQELYRQVALVSSRAPSSGQNSYHSIGEIARASQKARAIVTNDIILGNNHLSKVSSQHPALST